MIGARPLHSGQREQRGLQIPTCRAAAASARAKRQAEIETQQAALAAELAAMRGGL